MKKNLNVILTLVMIIVSIFLLTIFVKTKLTPEMKSVKISINTYQEKIGETLVIGNDTLVIVNYNIWDDTYTLSNGVDISSRLVGLGDEPEETLEDE